MTGENWADRTGDSRSVNPNVIKHLRFMLEHADAGTSVSVPEGGRLKTDRNNITLYSGGSYEFFDSLAKTLTVLLGAPVEDQSAKLPNDEIEARNVRFAGGVNIVFMAFRDSGISLSIPRESAAMVTHKLDRLMPPHASVAHSGM